MNVLITASGLRTGAGSLRRPAFAVALCLALTIVVVGVGVMPAAAGHGSWTHHHNHVWEEGSSNYGGYADVDAQYAYDYGHAAFTVIKSNSIIRHETVTCGPANEGCNYRRTTKVYWAQSSSTAKSAACAKDGSHELWGEPPNVTQCGLHQVDTHRHSIPLQ